MSLVSLGYSAHHSHKFIIPTLTSVMELTGLGNTHLPARPTCHTHSTQQRPTVCSSKSLDGSFHNVTHIQTPAVIWYRISEACLTLNVARNASADFTSDAANKHYLQHILITSDSSKIGGHASSPHCPSLHT